MAETRFPATPEIRARPERMCADVTAILGALDIVFGEMDR
jgi:hypothetical protein